jgi:hypothetical protein
MSEYQYYDRDDRGNRCRCSGTNGIERITGIDGGAAGAGRLSIQMLKKDTPVPMFRPAGSWRIFAMRIINKPWTHPSKLSCNGSWTNIVVARP